MDPLVGAFVTGFSLGFIVMGIVMAMVVHAIVTKHRAILAAHNIPHGKRESQTINTSRR